MIIGELPRPSREEVLVVDVVVVCALHVVGQPIVDDSVGMKVLGRLDGTARVLRHHPFPPADFLQIGVVVVEEAARDLPPAVGDLVDAPVLPNGLEDAFDGKVQRVALRLLLPELDRNAAGFEPERTQDIRIHGVGHYLVGGVEHYPLAFVVDVDGVLHAVVLEVDSEAVGKGIADGLLLGLLEGGREPVAEAGNALPGADVEAHVHPVAAVEGPELDDFAFRRDDVHVKVAQKAASVLLGDQIWGPPGVAPPLVVLGVELVLEVEPLGVDIRDDLILVVQVDGRVVALGAVGVGSGDARLDGHPVVAVVDGVPALEVGVGVLHFFKVPSGVAPWAHPRVVNSWDAALPCADRCGAVRHFLWR